MYGNIDTIAGKGQIRGKGENGWKESFERANAILAELSRPHHAIADKDGNIYVADKDAHGIRKITADGKIFTVAGTNEAGDDQLPKKGSESRLSSPNGIWVTKNGTVFILDLGNSKVKRLDPESSILSLVFEDPRGFSTGRGLWVSDDEKTIYYAAGTEVRKWTNSNGIEVIGRGFKGLGNLIVDPKGALVVTDRVGHQVYRLQPTLSSTEWTKEAIAGNGTNQGGGDGHPAVETGLNEVRGIWFHPRGGYFLGTHRGSQIWYVDVKGKIRLFVDGKERELNNFPKQGVISSIILGIF
jgi:DNA-binding beta-propeller fold protein YncE